MLAMVWSTVKKVVRMLVFFGFVLGFPSGLVCCSLSDTAPGSSQQSSNNILCAKQEKEDVAFRRLVEETAQSCEVNFAPGSLEFLAGKIGSHPRLGGEETKKMASYFKDRIPVNEI